jgi:TonB family protein
MRLKTWAGLAGVLTLVSIVGGSGDGGAAPLSTGNFYARIGANDAPLGGRFHIYGYFLDSLDVAVKTPGPGRVLALNFRGSNGKNAFIIPGDLTVQDDRKRQWNRGFCPLAKDGVAGLLGKDESRWALWWLPDSLAWNAATDLTVHYGFSKSAFVPMEDMDARATLDALPWDLIRAATLVADRPTGHVVRTPNPATFDEPPRVQTRKAPVYPKSARVYDYEGSVHVVAHVTEKGTVTDAYVIHSSAIHQLNVSALVAVMEWTFRPGKKGGIPVAGDIVIPVQFAIGTAK